MADIPRFKSNPQRPRPPGVSKYIIEPLLELAVNVALATQRPLLLQGEPGVGKSSLAADAAFLLGWEYESEVITSRTQAQDLLWKFDAVRRLAEAQAGQKIGGEHDRRFVEPGVLWKAYAPRSAREYGVRGTATAQAEPKPGTVVLLDEIDKADPDVPNDLLVVVDQRHFRVPELNLPVEAEPQRPVLMLITTNEERALPQAFVRRCVVFKLERHTRKQLQEIARSHFPLLDEKLLGKLCDLHEVQCRNALVRNLPAPSTAEFLDAVQACIHLKLQVDSELLTQVASLAMWKHGATDEEQFQK